MHLLWFVCHEALLESWYWHVALCSVIDLLCPTTRQLDKPKCSQSPVRPHLCLLCVPLQRNCSSICSLGEAASTWYALLQLLIIQHWLCCDDGLLRWQSNRCVTYVLPNFDPVQRTAMRNTKANICFPPVQWSVFDASQQGADTHNFYVVWVGLCWHLGMKMQRFV